LTGNHGRPSTVSGFLKRWRAPLIAAFYLILLAFCVHAIRTTLHENELSEFAASLTALGPVIVIQALLCVAGTYAIMCVIEQLVLRDVGARPPLGAAIATPLIANSLSIGLGFGALSGAAIRVRIYSRAGVDAQTCVLIASGVTLVSLAGGATLALLGMTFEPEAIASRLGFHVGVLRAIGIAGLTLIVLVLIAAGGRRQRLKVLGRQIHLPSARAGLLRLAAGAVDWLLSATVLFLLLPEGAQTHWLAFAAFFASLHFIAMSTGAPAGIGVFDAAMIGLNPTDASSGQLAAALLVYRLLSFIVPLVCGLIGLLVLEGHRDFGLHRHRSARHPPHATTAFVQSVMRRAIHYSMQHVTRPLRGEISRRASGRRASRAADQPRRVDARCAHPSARAPPRRRSAGLRRGAGGVREAAGSSLCRVADGWRAFPSRLAELVAASHRDTPRAGGAKGGAAPGPETERGLAVAHARRRHAAGSPRDARGGGALDPAGAALPHPHRVRRLAARSASGPRRGGDDRRRDMRQSAERAAAGIPGLGTAAAEGRADQRWPVEGFALRRHALADRKEARGVHLPHADHRADRRCADRAPAAARSAGCDAGAQ
jgi:uncharacterized membrane protein YbhN (UPF0104 family)